jgi:ubiquinone/menaquinone biosynthesis C-methylase UbiE
MNYELEREVNEHFGPFYPYVADEIRAEFGRDSGRVLEIGPYGPGVAVALAKKCVGLSLTCGDDSEGALAYFRECVDRENLGDRIEVRLLDKHALPFDEDTFDLVVFRGGLFFWDEQEKILTEMNRVLAAGGLGALGGGFGAGAPDDLIESLLPRARDLNNRLGKMRLSLKKAEEITAAAGLTNDFKIAQTHGLWIFWRKT